MIPSTTVTPKIFVAETLRILRRVLLRALPFLALAALPLWFELTAPDGIVNQVQRNHGQAPQFDLEHTKLPGPWYFIWLLSLLIVIPIIAEFCVAEYEERSQSIGDALIRLKSAVPKLIGFLLLIIAPYFFIITLVSILFAAAGLLTVVLALALVLMFGLSIMTWYFPGPLVAEEGGPLDLIKRIMLLSSHNFWRSLGYLGLATFLFIAFGYAAALLSYPIGLIAPHLQIAEILALLLYSLSVPLMISAGTVFYFDLRTRREGPVDYFEEGEHLQEDKTRL